MKANVTVPTEQIVPNLPTCSARSCGDGPRYGGRARGAAHRLPPEACVTTWQDEARGIEPWVGARVSWGRYNHGVVVEVSARATVRSWAGPTESDISIDDLLLFLDESDTRSAFDRRLASRLGAPPEAVEEGVIVGVDEVVVPAERRPDGKEHRRYVLVVVAGLTKRADYIDDPLVWTTTVDVDTDNALLARVRAWKSVTP